MARGAVAATNRPARRADRSSAGQRRNPGRAGGTRSRITQASTLRP